MNCQTPSQPWPHRNQTLAYSTLIYPTLSPQRSDHCSHIEQHVPFLPRFRPTSVHCISERRRDGESRGQMFPPHGTSIVSVLSWHQRRVCVCVGVGGIRVCWGRTSRMRDIHPNTIQMEEQSWKESQSSSLCVCVRQPRLLHLLDFPTY